MITIFLDIDGVLSTDKQYLTNKNKFHQKNEWAKKVNAPYPFDKKCVSVFNDILKTIDAQIVLSSDWRLHWSLEELSVIFTENGVIQSPVDITSNTSIPGCLLENNRSFEILQYITKHNIANWIVLDDLDLSPFIQNNFFRTNDFEGIKKTNLKEKIIKKCYQIIKNI